MQLALIRFNSLKRDSHFRHAQRLYHKLSNTMAQKCNARKGEPQFVSFEFANPIVAIPRSKLEIFRKTDDSA